MSSHQHHFTDWPFPVAVNTLTVCTKKFASGGFPALRVSHDHDGGWQFLDATTEDPGEGVLLCIGCVFERDATLAELSDLPIGWSAYREEVGAEWERWEKSPDEDDEQDEERTEHDCAWDDDKMLADIEQYGLQVISVTGEGDFPPFSYSVGIEQSLGLPELIVIGLKSGVAHSAINECYSQMKAGAAFVPGSRVAGLLGGDFECLIGEMSPIHFGEYMGGALRHYKGSNFRAYQIIFPSTANAFPWEPEASEWFRNWQPLLA